MTKSFQPCPALPFFDMYTTRAERRYKRRVLPEHISNEQHAKQLVDIEHNLWVLCDHFKVFPPEAEEEKEKKPPEQKTMALEEQLAEILTASDPEQQMQMIVEKALRSDADKLLKNIQAKHQEQMMKMFDLGRLTQMAQEVEKAQAKVPLPQYDHSYSVLTEIRTSIITVTITEDATSATTIRDQYGVPWQLRLRKDMDWLIVDVDTSQSRGVVGQFKLLVRFLHKSPLKEFPSSFAFEVSRIRTIYCGTLGSVSQLLEDGYAAANGTLKLRVAIIPMDPDAERSSLTVGKRLKQIPTDHNAHRMPKFTEGQLSIPDFLNSRTTLSPTLLDAKKTGWQLEVRLNQGANERERQYIAVSIRQCDSPDSGTAPSEDTCHEYFVELLTVDANGWTLRNSGRMVAGSISIPNFLLKCRVEIYLKEGMLRLRWGVRRIPIR